jgi:uncharacterized protein (UPF0147 family)
MENKNNNHEKSEKSSDFVSDLNDMLDSNGMPLFGTTEFNNMCSNLFGGNSSKKIK